MKISSRFDYGIRTLVALALAGPSAVLTVGDISRRQQIPANYLEQILLALKAAGVVSSRRGARGGYLLARLPEEITLADLGLQLSDPLLAEGNQNGDPDDPVRLILKDVENALESELRAVSIADVRDAFIAREKADVVDYSI